MNLLSQLRLGPAARPIYDLVRDLDNETRTAQWLEREIRNILRLHGAAACADAVICTLTEVGFDGLSQKAQEGGSQDKVAGGRWEKPGGCSSTPLLGEDTTRLRGRLQ